MFEVEGRFGDKKQGGRQSWGGRRGRWAGLGLGEGSPGITSAYLQPQSQGAQTSHWRSWSSLVSGQQYTGVPFRLFLPPTHSRNSPAQSPTLATGHPLVATAVHWHLVPAKNLGKGDGEAKTCWVGTEGIGGRDGAGRVTSHLLHDVSLSLLLDFPGGQKPSSSCGSGKGGLTLVRSGGPHWGISAWLFQPIR